MSEQSDDEEQVPAVVLDYLPHGRADDDRPQYQKPALAYALGVEEFRLFEVTLEEDVSLTITDRFDADPGDDLREQLEHIRWDNITDKMLYGLIHGYGVAEVLWGSDGQRVTIDEIKVRDRNRFRFDRDLNLMLIKPGQHSAG